ncbi:multicopper oxidase domain-containing protein [Candidatus Nitrosocosmicus franklandus]|uniref:Multicopper oxidase n=1 Tax=Candidatus Nitrosocosmicus franklandianus TaxID=1798806 RepID=A0A484IFE9_9ARCH|nr:multicopper oxidase domain-containing protein [Candidatus Nitrosocosmicus franklandus]VFJ14352.1 Multicopper oxidase [Candidatus Nitrosocosmicus franklandus]
MKMYKLPKFEHILTAFTVGLIISSFLPSSIVSVLAQSNSKVKQEDHPKSHEIEIGVAELSSDRIAYKMNNYLIRDLINNNTVDITSKYEDKPTIPGPTIVVNEGDKVKITLVNEMGWGYPSVHTHGAHYKITSDGTLKDLNKVSDQAASPTNPYTYEWDAANGTAGSWPFHDHTIGRNALGKSMDGLETVGLFSSIIINPSSDRIPALVDGIPKNVSTSDIDKDFILFVNDDVIWGSEIDYTKGGKHSNLGVNPTLTTNKDSIVRFNIQSIGNDFHNFTIDGIKWLKPGTNKVINSHVIGPLANHVFTIKADRNGTYYDNSEINLLGGMKGNFSVISLNSTVGDNREQAKI